MANVQRHLSIHFNTRFFKGVTNEDILNEVDKIVETESIASIQLTEKDCIISLKNQTAKEKLVTNGITLRNRSVNFLDVEKNYYKYYS